MDYERLLAEPALLNSWPRAPARRGRAGGVSACRQFPSKELTDTCHGFPCSPLR